MFRKVRKLLFVVLIFLVSGELLVRFDRAFEPLSKRNQVAMVAKVADSLELSLVQNHALQIHEEDFRVMVLGDSFMSGGGISLEAKASRRLKSMLSNDVHVRTEHGKVYMLDLSRPSNNMLDNYSSFNKYFKEFQPHIVILGYNMNDILGPLENKELPVQDPTNEVHANPVALLAKENKSSFAKFKHAIYSNSKLIDFASSNSQLYLRTKGVTLPFGDFYYLTHVAYKDQNPAWQTTKRYLLEMSHLCEKNRCHFLVYLLPEFNLLNHPELFDEMNNEFLTFLGDHDDLEYAGGMEDFDPERYQEYMMSKYDGHPGTVAHSRIAQSLFDEIQSISH